MRPTESQPYLSTDEFYVRFRQYTAGTYTMAESKVLLTGTTINDFTRRALSAEMELSEFAIKHHYENMEAAIGKHCIAACIRYGFERMEEQGIPSRRINHALRTISPLQDTIERPTWHQVEIIDLASQYKTNEEIGQALYIAPSTVKNLKWHAYRKLRPENSGTARLALPVAYLTLRKMDALPQKVLW